MTYYLYHIPGKKIGVTRNLEERVHKQQGYNEDEYQILAESKDITEISNLEIQMQKAFGYKLDRQLYKNLKCNNKMEINVTEQTSTFAVPLNKLKGHLMDNLGMSWETSHGIFEINMRTVPWIMDNAKTSMYNDNRSYVYNKAFAEYMKPVKKEIPNYDKSQMMFNRIRTWAETRGLYEKGNVMVQYVKLQEEAGELAKALLKDDQPEVIDAIGDMVVVLTNLAHQRGVYIETCIQSAYEVINKRTGKMINGTFVKDEN